jgi:bis(5'-nucleosyl)-tetraphosphatase (symmetrical)
MALYAIGDVQGCSQALESLLDELSFDPRRDRLWFAGDLVNRGPGSAAVLRRVRALGDAAVAVLGNHDLHLLAIALTGARTRRRDTLDGVLCAGDRDGLLDWLRHRPLFHHDLAAGCALVHAGLVPEWDVALAGALAEEVHDALRGPRCAELLRNMYGDTPDRWDADLAGWGRMRFVINAMTRLRYCGEHGRMMLRHAEAPADAPAGLTPWFRMPGRRSAGTRLVFGHWSTLGRWEADGVVGLDTGCVWGGELTAVRLDGDPLAFSSVSCAAGQSPP